MGSDQRRAGIVGSGMLVGARVTFDYGERRMFVETAAKTLPAARTGIAFGKTENGDVHVRYVAALPGRETDLRVGDRLNLGPDVALHVTTYQIPELGPPTADRVGKECPVCRIPFEADSRVFTCGTCATQMHLQGEEKPEPGRMSLAGPESIATSISLRKVLLLPVSAILLMPGVARPPGSHMVNMSLWVAP